MARGVEAGSSMARRLKSGGSVYTLNMFSRYTELGPSRAQAGCGSAQCATPKRGNTPLATASEDGGAQIVAAIPKRESSTREYYDFSSFPG
jgi:hypothetical protein